jgi:cation:H+ antiporter
MDLLGAIGGFVAGLVLVVYFAERLVRGVVGVSLGFGISAFLISVVFIGFDPENLAVGVAASASDAPGIALGSVVGAAIVATDLAFGITALVTPIRFERAPARVLVVPVAALGLFWVLALDSRLSRLDGALLIAGYVAALGYLRWAARHGLDIRASGEVAETLEHADRPGRWRPLGVLAVATIGIVVGSDLLVGAATTITDRLGVSSTVFGMTVLALLVSVEELARELPAALRGRPDISVGNVVGSVLAFVLFNAGVIAVVRPLPVGGDVLWFYLPLCLAALVVVTVLLARRKVTRVGGAVLVALYLVFFAAGYLR